MKDYAEFMKKAHDALILERENEIIMELRATREFLKEEIRDSSITLETKINDVDKKLHKRIDSVENKLEEIVSLLKK